MLQDICAASQALSEALDRYMGAFSSLQSCCSHGAPLNNILELSESLAKERSLTPIYHEKLSKAELTMRQIHNSPMITPVNRFPPEILASIFHLVQIQDMKPCSLERLGLDIFGTLSPACPKYPDILSHVCSRWRQVAIGSSHLWSHIDIALSCSLAPKLLSRAQTFVARAGQAPLYLHILDPGTHPRYQVPSSDSGSEHPSNNPDDYLDSDWSAYDNNSDEPDYIDEFDISKDLGSIFSSPTAIRIIEFAVLCKPHESHFSVLSKCLVNCLPGTLKKLGLFCRNHTQQISAAEGDESSRLHAGGIYPCWTSTAYCGLTSLRLRGGIMSVPESNLIDILRSNPRLRILELGINIERSVPIGSPVTPIRLDGLRLLNVTSMQEDGFDTFFRWLSPILTPLRLIFGAWPHSSAVRIFCGLSKVTELHFDHSDRSMHDDSTSVLNMLSLSPHLRVLVVEFNPSFGSSCLGPNDEDGQANCIGGPSSLDALYLFNCHYIMFDDLKQAVAKHSIRKIVFQGCEIQETERCRADDEMLRTLCPEVEIQNMPVFSPYPAMLEPRRKCPEVDQLSSCRSLSSDISVGGDRYTAVLSGESKYSGYPNYPETLLRICSHWRQIALSSPRLWSRIDVVLSDPAGQQLLERAEIFLERAGQSPLDLRIFDKPIRSWRPFLARSKDEFLNEEGYDEDFEEGSSDDSGGEEYEQDALYGSDDLSDPDGLGNSGVFSASIRPDASGFLPSLPELAPMRSIEFVIASKRSYSSVFAPILTRCFENCLPGTLTKLVLRVEADGSAGFILPSSKQAETVWLPITSLHILGGIRPPWGSNAFKGLTDLRFGESGSDSIPELQLIGAASPLTTTVEPIHLDDLEVLDLIEKHSDQKAVAFETFTRG
ncbi:hypothetical protein B0J17DRAFT_713286 [Rhizoctonia solani]|nr:hypothetical protein B0J17DRAFT_713286 [Rhizoctonia solani]